MLKLTSIVTLAFALLLLLHFGSQRAFLPEETAASSQVIGIALTATHATATRRYSNGSFHDLGRVESQTEYVELIERLTSWGSEHPRYVRPEHRSSNMSLTHGSPPYFSMEDSWNDWPRQISRSARKAVGLPASFDVAVLARLIGPVVKVVEETDSSPISALISFPALRGLYQEDIVDAATYVGLDKIANGYEYHPHELVATFAGHGLGLNPSGNDTDEFEHRPTLLVEYTEKALLLHHRYMTKAVEIPWPHMQLQMSFDMGSDQDPDREAIGHFVYTFLYDEYIKRIGGPAPDKVTILLSGSAQSLSDGKVEEGAALAAGVVGSDVEVFATNPEYMAARGAAELVRYEFSFCESSVRRRLTMSRRGEL